MRIDLSSDASNEASAFRLGDVRGIYPDEINEQFAYSFGQAFVAHYHSAGQNFTVATGRDSRDSSPVLQNALNTAFLDAGIDVLDLGLCPSEMGSFASCQPGIDAAIIVTASHNKPCYNGFKCVLAGGQAVSYQSGLSRIEKLMSQKTNKSLSPGKIRHNDLKNEYLHFLGSKFDQSQLHPGPMALNGLNGTASELAGELANQFKLNVNWLRREPGAIPEVGADPSHPDLASEMKHFMNASSYELGIAWDGDSDRCTFFEADGQLIPSYYMIGLFAEYMLKESPGSAIVYDTKLCWNILDVIKQNEGIPIPSETGHAFMRQKMVANKAIYGGELSSHHYFGDFYYCDSGMFAWLKAIELIQASGQTIQELVATRRLKFSCTPEINLELTDPAIAFNQISQCYGSKAIHCDQFDGLSFEMPGDWRFSLRRSKTESLVRLNIESKATSESVLSEGAEILDLLSPFKADDTNWHEQLYLQ